VVICPEQGAYLHMSQLMPLPLTVSCFSKIHIGFTFLVPAHLASPGQRAVKWVRARVCVTATSIMLSYLLSVPCLYDSADKTEVVQLPEFCLDESVYICQLSPSQELSRQISHSTSSLEFYSVQKQTRKTQYSNVH